jgi:hypothetical protein
MITIGKVIVNSMMNLVRKRALTADVVSSPIVREVNFRNRRIMSVCRDSRFDTNEIITGKRLRKETNRYQATDFLKKKSSRRSSRKPSPKNMRKSPNSVQGQKIRKRSPKSSTNIKKNLKNLNIKEKSGTIVGNTEHENYKKDENNELERRFNEISIHCQSLTPRANSPNSIQTEEFDLVHFNDSVKCYKSEDGFYFIKIDDKNGITHLKPLIKETDKNLVNLIKFY